MSVRPARGEQTGRVPVYLDAMFGREHEVQEIGRLVARERVVTLTGPGGVGKTRLAATVANEFGRHDPESVVWVGLGPLRGDDQVATAVLAELGGPDEGGATALAAVAQLLAERVGVLVVLDNCEHVLTGVRAVVDAVVRLPNAARLLLTSRRRVDGGGERVHVVPVLHDPPPLSGAPSGPAAALFAERAGRAGADTSAGDPAYLDAVAEICRRLDGLPMAIELAAARSRYLTPAQMLAELDQRFELLGASRAASTPHQQTLASSMAWSVELLDAAEQQMLRAVSVFPGGFEWEAAAAVVAGAVGRWEVLRLLGGLVDASLLHAHAETQALGDARMVFVLPESLRHFALDEAARHGEVDTWRDAHAAYWSGRLHVLDAAQPWPAATIVAVEHAADFDAALTWTSSDPGRHLPLLAMCAVHWCRAGRMTDVLRFAARLQPPTIEHRAAWARAYAACGDALTTTLSTSRALQDEAWDAAVAADDGIALLLLAQSAVSFPEVRVHRMRVGFSVASRQGLTASIVAGGELPWAFLADVDPDEAEPIFSVYEAACRMLQVRVDADLSRRVMRENNAVDRIPFYSDGHRERLIKSLSNTLFAVLSDDARVTDEALAVADPCKSWSAHARFTAIVARTMRKVIEGVPIGPEAMLLAPIGPSCSSIMQLAILRTIVSEGFATDAEEAMSGWRVPESPDTAAVHAVVRATIALSQERLDVANALAVEAIVLLQRPRTLVVAVDAFEILAVAAGRSGDHRRVGRLLG